jgi:hypothetical protein
MSSEFLDMETQMANNPMENCSSSLVTVDMRTEVKIRSHFTSSRLLKALSKCWHRGHKDPEDSYSGDRDQEDQSSKPARKTSSRDPILKTPNRRSQDGD